MVSYILIMLLRDALIIKVSLKKIRFPRGYYACIGSAKKGLTKRIYRHMTIHKKVLAYRLSNYICKIDSCKDSI